MAEHNQHDADRPEYVVRLGTEIPLHDDVDKDCISRIRGEILEQGITPDGKQIGTPIGQIRACRIYGGRTENEQRNLSDECDAHSQLASDSYLLLFDEIGEYQADTSRSRPRPLGSSARHRRL